MKNNKSVIVILSIVLVTSALLTTIPSLSFGQKETDTHAGNFDHIKVFDSNGKLISSWGPTGSGDGQFLHAHGIGLDSAGNVYVSDAENYNIQKFDSKGKFITKWGSKGSGDGQFLQPESIDVDSNGNVFVVDFKNANIQKFDNNGKFITKWGSKGTGEGQFRGPWGVAIDSAGNVYVSDQQNPVVQTRNYRIQKFSPDGMFISQWGSKGCGPDQFLVVHDLKVDSSDNIYISD